MGGALLDICALNCFHYVFGSETLLFAVLQEDRFPRNDTDSLHSKRRPIFAKGCVPHGQTGLLRGAYSRLAKVFANLHLATVQKIVTEILPPQNGVSFAKEARDLLIECCVEFITLISSEANEISEKEAKKTIACDHITKALEQLGFTDYVPAVMEAAQEHKEVQKVRATLFPSPLPALENMRVLVR